jgi:hypothetical protein
MKITGKNPEKKKSTMKIDPESIGAVNLKSSERGCPLLDRRQFLLRLGLTGGAMIALNPGALSLDGNLFNWSTKILPAPLLPGDTGVKPLIRVRFARAQDEFYMGWPGAAYDIKASQALYTETMKKAASRLGVMLDIDQEPLRNTEHTDAFLRKTKNEGADGALLIAMELPHAWNMFHYFTERKGILPTILFGAQGTHMHQVNRFRATPNCFVATTEDIEWLGSALHMLKVVWQMRQTRIAVIENDRVWEQRLEPLGTSLVQLSLEKFADAYDKTEGSEEAESIARRFYENAKGVVEPTREAVLEAARTYVANRRIMDESGCHAVTMDCLGLIKTRRTPPPCMAYMQLLNERTCGCCERDVNAALSLMLSSYLFQRPGFMHNPTPNTVLNQYGGTHCAAPTLMDGFESAGAEYLLRSHHESDWGVAPQVLLRENQPATVFKFLSADTIMAATGTILENIDVRPSDGRGGCRTTFRMAMDDVPDVRDIRGHHNLLVYGKHLNELRAWAQLSGVKVEHITGGLL